MDTQIIVSHAQSKEELYSSLLPQIQSLLQGENDLIANLANVSAALKMSFPSFSWVGFYLKKGDGLVLGPFQGKPACVRIAIGQGVCGTAADRKETVIVPDVTQFSGHIFCDPDSRSEIVVPIIKDDLLGLLDVDSAKLNNFDEIDKKYLEQLVHMISSNK
jgi:L-methionine (R)-S-oxide reductase